MNFDKKIAKVKKYDASLMIAFLLISTAAVAGGGIGGGLWGRGSASTTTSTSSSLSSTCTGDTCVIGDGGLYWDGGNSGAVFAQRFVASIAGSGTTAFECRNQTAASSPCINNPSNIMELFTTPPNKDQSNINFPDFLFLSQAPDGGTRTAGYLLGVLSGPSSAELPQAAFTWNGGLELNASQQGGQLTIDGPVADIRNPTAGGYIRVTSGGDTSAGPMLLYYNGLGTPITSGNFVEYYDSSATLIAGMRFDGTYTTANQKIPTFHNTSLAAQTFEAGTAALTASAVTVTFNTAFGAAPYCVCNHINATPIACGHGTTSTTSVQFFVPAGTGSIDWICTGSR